MSTYNQPAYHVNFYLLPYDDTVIDDYSKLTSLIESQIGTGESLRNTAILLVPTTPGLNPTVERFNNSSCLLLPFTTLNNESLKNTFVNRPNTRFFGDYGDEVYGNSLGTTFKFRFPDIDEFNFSGVHLADNSFWSDNISSLQIPPPSVVAERRTIPSVTWMAFNNNDAGGDSSISGDWLDDFYVKYRHRYIRNQLLEFNAYISLVDVSNLAGGGGGGVENYVELLDVNVPAPVSGLATHYNGISGKFEQVSEVNVDPSSRNVVFDTAGQFTALSAGDASVESVAGRAVLAGATDASMTAATGDSTVSSTTGQSTVFGDNGVNLDFITGTLALKHNGGSRIQMVSTGQLASNRGDYESLVTSDNVFPNKKYVDDAISGSGAVQNTLTNPLLDFGSASAVTMKSTSDQSTVFGAGGVNLDFNTGTLSLKHNGGSRIQMASSGQLASNLGNYETLVTSDNVFPNKKYVDDAASLKLTQGGDTFGVTLNAGTNDDQIVNLRQNGQTRIQFDTVGVVRVTPEVGQNARIETLSTGVTELISQNGGVDVISTGAGPVNVSSNTGLTTVDGGAGVNITETGGGNPIVLSAQKGIELLAPVGVIGNLCDTFSVDSSDVINLVSGPNGVKLEPNVSTVRIGIGSQTAAAYAANIVGNDDAVPNVKYVDDAVAPGVQNNLTNPALDFGSASAVTMRSTGALTTIEGVGVNVTAPPGAIINLTAPKGIEHISAGGVISNLCDTFDVNTTDIITLGSGPSGITLEPNVSTVRIGVSSQTAAAYATNIVGNDLAVPNVKYVDDKVANSGGVLNTLTNPLLNFGSASNVTLDSTGGILALKAGNAITLDSITNINLSAGGSGLFQAPNLVRLKTSNLTGEVGIECGSAGSMTVRSAINPFFTFDASTKKLFTNTANYEALVTADADIPNKKYVDDGLALKQDLLVPPRAYIYFDDNALSSGGTQNQVNWLQGVFVTNFMRDFSVGANNSIQYTGATTRNFEIYYSGTPIASNNDRTIWLTVYKNPIAITNPLIAGYVPGSRCVSTLRQTVDDTHGINGQCVVTLAQNEYIRVYVSNVENNDLVTMVDFRIFIKEIL